MSQYPWLLLAVYVVTIGAVQLLALWAATSTRPWLLRALVVWTPIALLAMIRATWPAMLLFISATLTIGLCWAIERYRRTRNPDQPPGSRWRFRLADLLVAMLFLATWLALGTGSAPWQYQPMLLLYVGLMSLPLALLSILSQRVVLGPQRVTMGLVALGIIWTCALLMRLGNAPLFLVKGGRRWAQTGREKKRIGPQRTEPCLLRCSSAVLFP